MRTSDREDLWVAREPCRDFRRTCVSCVYRRLRREVGQLQAGCGLAKAEAHNATYFCMLKFLCKVQRILVSSGCVSPTPCSSALLLFTVLRSALATKRILQQSLARHLGLGTGLRKKEKWSAHGGGAGEKRKNFSARDTPLARNTRAHLVQTVFVSNHAHTVHCAHAN